MHRPDGVTDIRHVAVDVDLDDVDEIVFAMVTEGHVRVEIAAWQGTTYGIESAATGAEASVIDRIMAQDITDNGRVEIGVAHSHQNRSGLDLWSVHGLDLEPVPGEGGCARNNSFGDFGARVADQGGDEALEIVGTCAGFFGFVGRSVTWHWDGTTYVASDSDAPERDD